MKPVLTPEESASFRRRLLYARWLYQKGTVDAQSQDELSHLTAIMHFHNAIEIVLHNIAIAYRWLPAQELRSRKFDAIVQAVDNKGTGDPQPPSVPQRTQIVRLADMRNMIMHHGHRYHRSEVEDARNVCRLFIHDAVRDFFEEDIDTLSMADLIENPYVRKLLHLAEKHESEGNYTESIGVCTVIFYLAQRALALGLGAGAIDARRELDSEVFHSGVRKYREFARVFSRTANLIDSVYGNSLFFSSGIDVDLAVRFFELGFRVLDRAALNDRERQIMVTKLKVTEIEQSDASLSITFAQDVALKIQSMGIGRYMTRKHLFREPEYIGSREGIVIDLPSEVSDVED